MHALPFQVCALNPGTLSTAAGLQDAVTVQHGDALAADLTSATVVFVYLLPEGALSCLLRVLGPGVHYCPIAARI
jgi:hypothetical protein